MRLALALLAALALAGCRVDLDGAACAEPGSASDCPSGQACGNDLRCSGRALACASTRCTPAPGPVFCASPDGAAAERCADADPVCGAVVAEPCSPTVGAALAAAAEHALATAGEVTVTLRGRGEGEAVFASESFPLAVPAGVALDGTTAPAGAAIVGAAGPSAPLLAVAGTVRGLRIEPADASGAGVSVACGPTGAPSLADVVVAGGGKLETGIAVSAADCGATLARVDVSGATGAALAVESGPGLPVTVVASRFSGSGTGIRVTEGKVAVGSEDAADAVEVSGNGGDGVVLVGALERTIEVTLDGMTIADNGGTGLVLDQGNGSSTLTVRRSVVFLNGHAAPRSYGPVDARREVGGIFIRQGSLSTPLVFERNRLSANRGDQLAFQTSSAWSISPGTCPKANLFGCAGSGHAVGVAGGGSVDARYSVWPDVDRVWVSAGVTNFEDFCNGSEVEGVPTPPTSCPSP